MKRTEHFKKPYINGSPANAKQLDSMIHAIKSVRIRTERGGFLFKAATDDQNLYFGIIPCIWEGERNHHYDIQTPKQISIFLTGNIIPTGVYTILFIPESRVLGYEIKQSYKNLYKETARHLLHWGINSNTEIDPVTSKLLYSTGLYENEITDLAGLADKN